MEAEELHAIFSAAVRVTGVGDDLLLTTQCLYPSNNAVSVAVRGRGNEFVVSDDGGAMIELSDIGFADRLTDRQIGGFVKPQGLRVHDGAIFSPVLSRDALPVGALLVANASKEVADWGSQHLRFRVKRNFKADLAALLDRHFHESLKHDTQEVAHRMEKNDSRIRDGVAQMRRPD